MKKILFILSFVVLGGVSAFAQTDEDSDKSDAIRDKMKEFIQKRLKLSKAEAEKFSPVFIRYFNEWRNAVKLNRQDKLILQQKIIELRIRYRNEFKEIIGEKRSNDVYRQQDIFIKELNTLRKERLENRPNKRINDLR